MEEEEVGQAVVVVDLQAHIVEVVVALHRVDLVHLLHQLVQVDQAPTHLQLEEHIIIALQHTQEIITTQTTITEQSTITIIE